jgi:hypothetical protein
MIYSYLKEELDFMKYNPDETIKKLNEAKCDVERLFKEFDYIWSYCHGCRGYVKRAEAYEGYTDNNRPVLRCGSCNSIWKFLDGRF